MAVTRIWNITDGGQEGVTPHTRMVLGQSLKPGQFMRVEAVRLVGATKLQEEVNAKLLAVGAQPPQWYAQKKKPPRAVVDGRIVGEDGRAVGKKVAVVKGHVGGVPAEAMAADVAEKIDEVAPGVPIEEPAEEPKAEDPVDEPAEEPKDKGGFRSKRKKR